MIMAGEPSRFDTVFCTAIEIQSGEARAAYIARACGGDNELRDHVQKLVAAHFRAGSFMECPDPKPATSVQEQKSTEQPGTVIGPYKLLQQIGEGGMGTVYMAEQNEPVRRMVALKIIKPGMDTREVIARFEAERQSLALMDHSHIAKVFDAGATESGRPYFVMELVKGVPITKYCDELNLSIRERLELFVPVCQAIQHAHHKGIIHRDIKPSNVLVAMQDGKPIAKVIDFGVAKALHQKLTKRTMMTAFGAVIGTFDYMSPEQAELSALDIDTRSDVYALGALLYELLTGTTPFDHQRLQTAAFDEIRRIIREEEPPRPSTRLSTLGADLSAVSAKRKSEPGKLSAFIRGDLDWIVMKALEKDRVRRYESANAFAADVRRFLSEEAVEACPPSTWYRFRKLVRRNKAAATTVGLVAATLVLGIVGTTFGLVRAMDAEADALAARDEEARHRLAAQDNAARAKANANLAAKQEQLARVQAKLAEEHRQTAEKARQLAEANESKAESQRYVANIVTAHAAWEFGSPLARVHLFLNQCPPGLRGWEHNFVYSLTKQEQQTLDHAGSTYCAAFSPDGKWLASASGGFQKPGAVAVWDVGSGQKLWSIEIPTGTIKSVAFSPDGKRLAGAGWRYNQQKKAGGALAINGAPILKLWDSANGQELKSLEGHSKGINGVAFSPDGKWLASASADRTVKIWEWATGRASRTLEGNSQEVSSVAFSPDGKLLAGSAGGASQTGDFTRPSAVILWDTASGRSLWTLMGHKANVNSVAFSSDGRRLATASDDKTVKLWELASGKEYRTLSLPDSVSSAAFSPDGKLIATAEADGTAKIWDTSSGNKIKTFKGHIFGLNSVTFSPDGRLLATSSFDRTVKIWTIASQRISVGPMQSHGTTFSPDGKRLAGSPQSDPMALSGRGVTLWEVDTGKVVTTLEGLTEVVHSLAFSPDGKRLATRGPGPNQLAEVKLWDASTGKAILPLQGQFGGNRGPAYSQGLAFGPNGKRLAIAGDRVKLWDTDTGKEVLTPQGQTETSFSVAFSPDGKFVAAGLKDYTVSLWDADSGQLRHSLTGHAAPVMSLAFSSDGKYLASSGMAFPGPVGEVKLWQVGAGLPVLSIKTTKPIIQTAFSPDGKSLAGVSWDDVVTVWSTANGQELLTLKELTLGLPGTVAVAFSPDGKRLVGVHTGDGTIHTWDASRSMKAVKGK
jgi:WD40 repeat protein/serine/threonine protein kinase